MSSKTALRRHRMCVPSILIVIAVSATVLGLLTTDLSSINIGNKMSGLPANTTTGKPEAGKKCATVEEMGEIFSRGYVEESLRVRRLIGHHLDANGASRVRNLPPEEFCKHGFVIGKASEGGLGNEMYRILTAAALSVMLNRSLIIGQTRGRYPFEDYLSYSDTTFTLDELKHLWKQNHCLTKYKRHLTMRIDDFMKPSQTHVLCSNWRKWEQPIIWFRNTTDAMAAQFFLKNVHPEMREAASDLFGTPKNVEDRPNVFGELMRVLISPSKDIQEAVSWALRGGGDPDIVIHMRMMTSTFVGAKDAAVECLNKALRSLPMTTEQPRVVLLSDTPSMVSDIAVAIEEFAEVLHFDYENYGGNVFTNLSKSDVIGFRMKDWGPAPRWVAFVEFFLASRAKHVVISGAHHRVGTTYAQLIAALAAAHRLDESSGLNSSITFLSSFQSTMLRKGLKKQAGWGHVWNRFSGPLSCPEQPNQCALTPLVPPGWWDGLWQSPIPRDVRRMKAYGVKISGLGTCDDSHLYSFCDSASRQSRTNRIVVDQLI